MFLSPARWRPTPHTSVRALHDRLIRGTVQFKHEGFIRIAGTGHEMAAILAGCLG